MNNAFLYALTQLRIIEMKKIINIFLMILLAYFTNIASAATLDFNNSNNLGVTLGGGMTWNSTGGGHLYNEYYDNDDYINFSDDTYVNSFEMNAMPWEGYQGGNIGSIDIAGLDSLSQIIWNTTVNLSNHTTWDNWFTVSVETAGIKQLAFTAPGNAPHFNGFWPSIDNMIINEQVSQVPTPSTIILVVSAFAGLGFSRKRKSL